MQNLRPSHPDSQPVPSRSSRPAQQFDAQGHPILTKVDASGVTLGSIVLSPAHSDAMSLLSSTKWQRR